MDKICIIGCTFMALTWIVPASAQNAALDPPLATQTFPALGVNAYGVDQSSNGRHDSYIQRIADGGLTISYDSTADSYAFHLTSGTTSEVFGPSLLKANNGSFREYQNPSINQFYPFETFSIFKPGSGNTLLPLHYVDFGMLLQRTRAGAGQYGYQGFAFMFGIPTALAAMPRSGAALFNGIVDGFYDSARLTGSDGSILVNFYTGEVATTLGLVYIDTSGNSQPLGRLEGRGTMTNGTTQFDGTLTGTRSGSGAIMVGGFNGGLYGPNFEEAGETFAASTGEGGAGSKVSGALVAINANALPTGKPLPNPVTYQATANASLNGPLLSDIFRTYAAKTILNRNIETGIGSPPGGVTTSGVQGAVASLPDDGTIGIRYDATTDAYIVSDATTSATFVATMAVAGTPTGIRNFTSGNDALSLFLPNGTNALKLTYLSYGLWSSGGSSDATRSVRAFVYGVPTAPADMPRTGQATFAGLVDGIWTTDNNVFRLGGGSTGSITANFASGAISTSIQLVGTLEINPSFTQTLGMVDGTGTIATGTANFIGTMSGVDNAYKGNFSGGFFGPGAAEAGMAFSLRGPDFRDAVSGVLVGLRQ